MMKFFRYLTFLLRSCRSLVRFKIWPPVAQRLELGAGPVPRPGWITVDQCKGADLVWDLRKPLPIRTGSMEMVYASHVLEHFAFPDLCCLLEEVRRVLRPGGRFLVAVPDAALYVEIYNGTRSAAAHLTYQPAIRSDKRMDVLNYIFYMDGHHRFMFDAESIVYHFERAGFVGCRIRQFEPSLDSSERAHESLYAECMKG